MIKYVRTFRLFTLKNVFSSDRFSLLLFVVIFCYVQSIPTESTTTTSAPGEYFSHLRSFVKKTIRVVLVVAAVLVDVKDEQNLNILAKLNRSIPEESEPKSSFRNSMKIFSEFLLLESSDDMSEYYNWLSFIKTSTVPSNSSEILLKNNN